MNLYYKNFYDDLKRIPFEYGISIDELIKKNCQVNPSYLDVFLINKEDDFRAIKEEHFAYVKPKTDIFIQATPQGLGGSAGQSGTGYTAIDQAHVDVSTTATATAWGAAGTGALVGGAIGNFPGAIIGGVAGFLIGGVVGSVLGQQRFNSQALHTLQT